MGTNQNQIIFEDSCSSYLITNQFGNSDSKRHATTNMMITKQNKRFQYLPEFEHVLNSDTEGSGACSKTRLLFLDFDGVINTDEIYWERRRVGEASGEERFIPMVGLSVDSWRLPLANNIECVNQLLDRSGALLVLSSTWRKLYPINDMNRLFSEFGFRHPIVAYTPYAPGIGRGMEIKGVIDACSALDSFVILDDDIEDMRPFMQNVVQTDKVFGLTMREVEAALEVLEDDDCHIFARE